MQTFDLSCDLDHRGSDAIVALCTLSHIDNADYLCQVI